MHNNFYCRLTINLICTFATAKIHGVRYAVRPATRSKMKQLPAVGCLLLLVSWVACAPVPLGSYPSSYVVNALSAKLADFLDPADLDCESCKIIVGVLQQLMMRNATEDEITHIIARICIDLKIEDQHVCKLIVVEFKVHSNCSSHTSRRVVAP